MKEIEVRKGRYWLKEYRMGGFYILPLLGYTLFKGTDYFLGYRQIEAGWGKIKLVLNIELKR